MYPDHRGTRPTIPMSHGGSPTRANARHRAWRWFHPTSKNQASINDALREPINFRNQIRISWWIIQMIVTLVMSSLAKHLCWRSLHAQIRQNGFKLTAPGRSKAGCSLFTTTNKAKWACRKIYFNLEKKILCIWMLLLSLQIFLYMILMRIVTCRNLGQAPLGVWNGQLPLELLLAPFPLFCFRLISDFANQPATSPIFECPTCPELPFELFPLDPFSVCVGIFVGFWLAQC